MAITFFRFLSGLSRRESVVGSRRACSRCARAVGALKRFSLLRHARGMKQHEIMERPITLRLSPAVREAVEREAERDRRSVAAMVRILVEDGLAGRQQAAEVRHVV